MREPHERVIVVEWVSVVCLVVSVVCLVVSVVVLVICTSPALSVLTWHPVPDPKFNRPPDLPGFSLPRGPRGPAVTDQTSLRQHVKLVNNFDIFPE